MKMKNIYNSPELDIIEIKASQVLTDQKSGEFDLDDEDDFTKNFIN